ncbi:hypothetical protein [Mesorhizobium sp.]|uniref:hypothetical protein n=1 Tax=Mesorhizobium sp. TaxID=1871066 RepID=UPI000FE32212|nr:hypothetical protein [Mesorhizobium sp.]RWQ12386.1 MAG: hypothetical protein EOR91_01340 [Mesorhizobium sp.]
MTDGDRFAPRFMTDQELRQWFGLSERALDRLRATRFFPPRDALVNKTDRRSVEVFFDRRAGLDSHPRIGGTPAAVDGEENFGD